MSTGANQTGIFPDDRNPIEDNGASPKKKAKAKKSRRNFKELYEDLRERQRLALAHVVFAVNAQSEEAKKEYLQNAYRTLQGE